MINTKFLKIPEFFCFLFLIALFFNLEINIINFSSEGERISNTVTILNDIIFRNLVKIPFNIIDLVFILSLIYLLFFKFKNFKEEFSLIKNDNIKLKIFISLICLCTILLLTQILNLDRVTSSQFIIQFLHLLKILEMFAIFFIFSILSRNIAQIKIIKYLIILSIFFSLLGILNFLEIYFFQIDNRIAFGVISIFNFTILPLLYIENIKKIPQNKIWDLLLVISIFLSIFGTLISGKRTVFIVSIITLTTFIIFLLLRYRIFFKHKFAILISCILTVLITLIFTNYFNFNEKMFSKFNIINKTFETKVKLKNNVINDLKPFDQIVIVDLCDLELNNYENYGRLINNVRNFNEHEKLTRKMLNLTSRYSIESTNKISQDCLITKLDHSSIIRIIKYVKTSILFFENPIFGIGFWSTQYIYNYLPDNILQLFLEIGLIGIFFTLIIFVYIFKYFKKMSFFNSLNIKMSIILASINLIGFCLLSNPLYEWRILLLFMIYICLISRSKIIY